MVGWSTRKGAPRALMLFLSWVALLAVANGSVLQADEEVLDRLSAEPLAVSDACTTQLLLPLIQNCGFNMSTLLRIASTRRVEVSDIPAAVCEDSCGLAMFASLRSLPACSEAHAWLTAAQATPTDVVRAVLNSSYDEVCAESQDHGPTHDGKHAIDEPEGEEDGSPCARAYRVCGVDGIVDKEAAEQLERPSPLYLTDEWECPSACVGAPVAMLTGPSCAPELLELAVGRSAGALDARAAEALFAADDNGMRRICEKQLSSSEEVSVISMFITGVDLSSVAGGGVTDSVLELRRIIADRAGVLTRYVTVKLSESHDGRTHLVDLSATVVFARSDWINRYKFEVMVIAGPSQLFSGTKVRHAKAVLQSVHTETSTDLEDALSAPPTFEQASAATTVSALRVWGLTVCLVAALYQSILDF